MPFGGEFLRNFGVFLKFFEVNTCIYAIFRNSINCGFVLKNVVLNLVLSSLLLVLATLTTITLYMLMLPLIFYKIIITLVLAVKYKEDFGGLLKGSDVIWSCHDSGSNNVVTYLLVVQFNKSEADLVGYVKKVCAERFLHFSSRLTSVRRSFMGYSFLVKKQLNIEDVVRELPHTLTLRKAIQEHCNKPLPKNNAAAWELLIGTHPIDLEDCPNLYPLLIRIHHTIADGVTFLSLLAKYISDEKAPVMNVPKFKNPLVETWDKIKKIMRIHSHLLLFLNRADVNALHNHSLSGVKRVGLFVEREQRYLKIVRGIKEKVEGATFTSVILTAMSASLDDYFKKTAQPPPEDLILTFIEIADRNQLKFDHADLSNIFSIGSIRLPVALKENQTLLERFLKVINACNEFTRSYDLWINQCMLHVFIDLAPTPLLRFILKMNDVTTISFSNLPGFQKIHIGGNALRHLLFWAPNYQSMGLGFTLVTYDDRFQMGLTVDKALISEEDDVQEVLEGIFKHVDLMDVLLTQ